ncbi:MAG: tetratricopeptide repeat protein [Bacteroidetes bacterium]|nr:tetratricopeptide repeat protein [Bacteroidota bacterium]
MKALLMVFAIVTMAFAGLSQNRSRLDSLWNEYDKAEHDTVRIKLLNNEIGYLYEAIAPDSAILFYNRAFSLADEAIRSSGSASENTIRQLIRLKADALQNTGFVHHVAGNYDQALDKYMKSLKIRKDMVQKYPDFTEGKTGMSKCCNNIATLHFHRGSYETALVYYLRALKLNKETGRKDLMASNFNNIGLVYRNLGNNEKALEYFMRALEINRELGNKELMASNYNNIGIVYKNQGDYDKAVESYRKAIGLNEATGNRQQISSNYINIGLVRYHQGSYERANESFFRALKIKEELNDKKGMSECYTNIGLVYSDLCCATSGKAAEDDVNKAIGYYSLSLEIDKDLNDRKGMSICLNNIGNVYYYIDSIGKAIEYYQKSLKIAGELSDKKTMSMCLNNIGSAYKDRGEYEKAIEYYNKSLQIKRDLNDNNGITICNVNIAALYITLAGSPDQGERQRTGNLEKASEYGKAAYDLAIEIGAVPMQNDAAAVLQKAFTRLGCYKEALKYAEVFIQTQDSMFSKEKTRALAEMGARYEAEKKQLLIENLNKENALRKAELAQSEEKRSKQLVMIYSFVAGFVIILVFSVIIFRLFIQKKRANVLLVVQKEQIQKQNALLRQANEEISAQRDEISAQRDLVTIQKERIEEQKKEIDDSIRYAKRIQTAVLPADKYAGEIMGDHFIIFRPKDVVSGDFYWATTVTTTNIVGAKGASTVLSNHLSPLPILVVAVADCTGHGVPGAFMSMLGISFLNEIVRKREVTNAAMVLNQLRSSVIEALKQTGGEGEAKDGMDISLAAIETDTLRCRWAGANNPLWIIPKNVNVVDTHGRVYLHNNVNQTNQTDGSPPIITEYRPDKMPVAIHPTMESFTNHEIQLKEGDRLYLFSDGFPDQFGGPKGKKFKYSAFRKLVKETVDPDIKKQGIKMEQALEDWMNPEGKKYEQVDDITVLAMKI